MFSGEVEVDESYLGGYRRGIQGRGVDDKVAIFGVVKRNWKAYAQILPDTRLKTLNRFGLTVRSIRMVCHPTIYWVCLIFKHYHISHLEKYVDGHNFINGIEIFWNQTKRHLRNTTAFLASVLGSI